MDFLLSLKLGFLPPDLALFEDLRAARAILVVLKVAIELVMVVVDDRMYFVCLDLLNSRELRINGAILGG